jgi:hypothetical protein
LEINRGSTPEAIASGRNVESNGCAPRAPAGTASCRATDLDDGDEGIAVWFPEECCVIPQATTRRVSG